MTRSARLAIGEVEANRALDGRDLERLAHVHASGPVAGLVGEQRR